MTTPLTESPEARQKRMRMRSWRRGTKEMDLILGPYADVNLGQMGDAELEEYDALLSENDQDLYEWVTARAAPPDRFTKLIGKIAHFAKSR